MTEISEFVSARLDEAEAALASPHAVWRLDHGGYGTTLHATSEHAKAWAEGHEPDGDTYWRWDDTYRLKRHGETIATIRRVEVLGSDEARAVADIAAKRVRLGMWREALDRRARATKMITSDSEMVRTAGRYVAAEANGFCEAVWKMVTLDASLDADHPDFDPAWRIDG